MNLQDPEPLRIRQIRIDGLFGLYNHCINLNLKERVTILHGPNGVGKTITLRMVEAMLKGKFEIFWKVPFHSFSIEFDNNNILTISHFEEHEYILKLSQTVGPEILHENNIYPKTKVSDLMGVSLTGSRTEDEFRAKFNSYQYSAEASPSWLVEFNNKFDTYFIQTQRLLKFSATEKSSSSISQKTVISSTIIEYANDLSAQIESTLASYARESQVLDQSFPQRLLSESSRDDNNIKIRMSNLDCQRRELREIGLLDQVDYQIFDSANLDELIATEKKVMMVYIQDTEQKLSVLADLARRIKLLLNSINTKFQNKYLRIDRDKGFVVTNDAGQNLDLDSLSSGEQHEIVLLSDLLFSIKPNTLVLIDEPELSLHVVWQKRFLPDLLKIAEVAQIDVLIATHSPYIVGDYTDLMVALETGASRA